MALGLLLLSSVIFFFSIFFFYYFFCSSGEWNLPRWILGCSHKCCAGPNDHVGVCEGKQAFEPVLCHHFLCNCSPCESHEVLWKQNSTAGSREPAWHVVNVFAPSFLKLIMGVPLWHRCKPGAVCPGLQPQFLPLWVLRELNPFCRCNCFGWPTQLAGALPPSSLPV